MGMISFSYHFSRMPVLSVLLAPLQTLAALFVPANPSSGKALARPAAKTPCNVATGSRVNPTESAYQARAHTALLSQHGAKNIRATQPPQPPVSRLKIVREFEPGMGRTCAGRMMISGRMDDVCAELDRMEQRERAARHH